MTLCCCAGHHSANCSNPAVGVTLCCCAGHHSANCSNPAVGVTLYCCRRAPFTKLLYFVLNEGLVVDPRRMASVTPSLSTVAAACAGVKTPSGHDYVFITDTASLGKTAKRRSCFSKTVRGAVARQDFAKFEEALRKATISSSSVVDSAKLAVTVMAAEEQVDESGWVQLALLAKMLGARFSFN